MKLNRSWLLAPLAIASLSPTMAQAFVDCSYAQPGTYQWQNAGFPAQSGRFSAVLDVAPHEAGADNLVAFSSGPKTNWTGLAAIVRFNSNNMIDVRDGGSYRADVPMAYKPGTYTVRMDIDVPARTYSVYIKEYGSTVEQRIAYNYRFRTEQQGVTSLNNVVTESEKGLFSACGVSFTDRSCKVAKPGATQWQNTPLATSNSSWWRTEWDATPLAAGSDALVALSQGAQRTWTGLATIVRFNSNNTIDVRDGASYRADAVVPYAPNATYHFRQQIYIWNQWHTYNVYVTPPGGAEQLLISGAYFRTEQGATDHLNNWVAEAERGGISVCNFKVGE